MDSIYLFFSDDIFMNMNIHKYVDDKGGDNNTHKTFFIKVGDDYLINKSVLFDVIQKELYNHFQKNKDFSDVSVDEILYGDLDERLKDEDGNPIDDTMMVCRERLDLTDYYVYDDGKYTPFNKYTNEDYYVEVVVRNYKMNYGNG